jgi:predicted alpha/beta-fold hydrolase
MPLLDSTYRAPGLLNNGHLLTIYPTLLRRVDDPYTERESIATPDGDVLTIDYSRSGSHRVVVLTHGLEGDSGRQYMTGMAQAFRRRGWDVAAWNCRGCGGEMNRLPRFYHSGATEDLRAVVRHLLEQRGYASLALVGFSLGGNMTLKYLGEEGEEIDERISGAVAFSVPCDLEASADRLALPVNRIYMHRFLRSLRDKIERKREKMPEALPNVDFRTIRTFHDFDEHYTAPLHGFLGARDYWNRCSSRQFVERISVPTLLVNALDDPFLSPECMPVEEAARSPWLSLERPRSGGHVGFVRFDRMGEYWSDARAVAFLQGERDAIRRRSMRA